MSDPKAPCCESSHDPPDTACKGYLEGSCGRCVYCDHEEKCHPGPGATCWIGSGESGPLEDVEALKAAVKHARLLAIKETAIGIENVLKAVKQRDAALKEVETLKEGPSEEWRRVHKSALQAINRLTEANTERDAALTRVRELEGKLVEAAGLWIRTVKAGRIAYGEAIQQRNELAQLAFDYFGRHSAKGFIASKLYDKATSYLSTDTQEASDEQ